MPSSKSKTKQKPKTWEFDAIGTHWWLAIFEPVSDFEVLQQQLLDRIETFDVTYSRFRKNSLVSAVAREAGSYDFPADSLRLFNFYRDMYDATDGAVTPLIGDMLVAAGYDADYSLQPGELVASASWDDVLAIAGSRVTTKKPVTLDFGAAGKGYLIDIIATLLHNAGIQNFCIDGGGDMLIQGNESLEVGLENPDDTSQVIGIVDLKNHALCGSAGNRRAWAGYHHIMHPQTLQSVQEIKAVWVAAKTAMLADGLATALFFVPPAHLSQFDFEYLLIDNQNQIMRSIDFPAKLF